MVQVLFVRVDVVGITLIAERVSRKFVAAAGYTLGRKQLLTQPFHGDGYEPEGLGGAVNLHNLPGAVAIKRSFLRSRPSSRDSFSS